MFKGLIGRKIGMTQIFDENGAAVPVTLLEAGPCFVSQVKTVATDGYNAVQLAFGEVKLDHALISTMANPRTQTLVKLAVDAAQRCHATVVAEGIETQAEEAMVRQLGVHVGQGYFYAHPLGIDELLAFKLPAPQVPGAALSPTGGRPGGDQSASLTPVPLASM